MTCLSTHSPRDAFCESDHRYLRETNTVRGHYVSQVLQRLHSLACSPTDSPQEVIDLLRQESFSPIPAYIIKSSSSGNGSVTAITHRSENSLVPKSSGSYSPMRGSMSNREYDQKLSTRVIPGTFKISVSHPLPIPYEAQCDIRYVATGSRRRKLENESAFAPLFSKSKHNFTSTETSSWTDEERAILSFLTPSADEELNPRLSVERKNAKKEQYHFEKYDKVEYNSPRKTPNLHKKVKRDFVPSCTSKMTVSAENYFDGNEMRILTARSMTHAPQWRY